MEELIIITLTSSFTLLGGIIIFIITNYIEKKFIYPYFEYKKKLVELNILLKFRKNILTNSFERTNTDNEFRNKVFNTQESVRLKWAEISSIYCALPSIRKNYLPEKDIKLIETNLLFLSNSSLFYSSENISEDTSSKCIERTEKIEQIIKILDEKLSW